MRYAFVALIIFTLLLGSCVNSSNIVGRDPNTAKLNDFRRGQEGLKLTFLDRFPPNEVGQTDNVPVILQVKNNGAADVEFGRVVVQSTVSNVQLTPSTQEINLIGKSSFAPEGEQANVEFAAQVNGLGVGQAILVGYACYPYQTKYVDSICIDPNLGKLDVVQQSCVTTDLNPNGGQGAPISVSNVKVLPLIDGDSVRYKLEITINNNEGGRIISRFIDSTECTADGQGARGKEAIDVKVEVSDAIVRCEQDIKGMKDTFSPGKIICETGPLRQQSPTLSPIVVTLDYGYISKEISKTVTIYDPEKENRLLQ